MSPFKTVIAVVCGLAIVIFTANGPPAITAAQEPPAPAAKEEKKAEKPLTAAQKEVADTIQAYDEAVARKDIDRTMAAFAPTADTIVLGTGKDESWRGPEEIRDAHLHFFKDFEKETVEPVWRQINVSGDMAWFAGLFRFVDENKGKENEFFMNISAVLEKKDGKWRIVLLHVSNPTGPEKQG